MSLKLDCHPDSYCGAVDDISVNISLSPSKHLILKYIISGDIDGLNLPAHTQSIRTDDLWEETCMEIFLKPAHGDQYFEMNFAPSSRWAVFQFESYRKSMPHPDVPAPPVVRTHLENATFTLFADIDLSQFQELGAATEFDIGLSAVIEELSSRKSFWALAHAEGAPDFHNKDCFIHQLQAAEAP